MTTKNSAVVKIIAKHTKEYNELDRLYKKLGVKHLTLLEVHKETLEKMAKFESEHHDLREEHSILVSRFVDIKIVCSNLKAENKAFRKILEAIKVE